MYADLRFPPTPGNVSRLSQWVPCPPATPCPPLKCPPRPAPPIPSFWVSSPKQILSSPALGVGGRRGLMAGNAHSTPRPQHRQTFRLSALPTEHCRDIISRTVKLLQTGFPPLFPGSPTASCHPTWDSQTFPPSRVPTAPSKPPRSTLTPFLSSSAASAPALVLGSPQPGSPLPGAPADTNHPRQPEFPL